MRYNSKDVRCFPYRTYQIEMTTYTDLNNGDEEATIKTVVKLFGEKNGEFDMETPLYTATIKDRDYRKVVEEYETKKRTAKQTKTKARVEEAKVRLPIIDDDTLEEMNACCKQSETEPIDNMGRNVVTDEKKILQFLNDARKEKTLDKEEICPKSHSEKHPAMVQVYKVNVLYGLGDSEPSYVYVGALNKIDLVNHLDLIFPAQPVTTQITDEFGYTHIIHGLEKYMSDEQVQKFNNLINEMEPLTKEDKEAIVLVEDICALKPYTILNI